MGSHICDGIPRNLEFFLSVISLEQLSTNEVLFAGLGG